MCGTLHALPHLKARGGGAIVNTCLRCRRYPALRRRPIPPLAAVLHFSKVTAADPARHRIRRRNNPWCPVYRHADLRRRFWHDRQGRSSWRPRWPSAAAVRSRPVAPGPEDAEAVLYRPAMPPPSSPARIVVDGGLTIGTRASWDPVAPRPLQGGAGPDAGSAAGSAQAPLRSIHLRPGRPDDLFHFSVSAAMNRPVVWVPPTGVALQLDEALDDPGFQMRLRSRRESWSMIGCGVPAGATSTNQASAA